MSARNATEAGPPDEGSAVVSNLDRGPALARLVEAFVAALPERAAVLERHLAVGELSALARVAHQLKGTAGGYGFPSIMEAAAAIVAGVRGDHARAEIAERVHAVVELCRRARARPAREAGR